MEDLRNQLGQLNSALIVASEEDKAALVLLIKDLQSLIDSVQVVNTTEETLKNEEKNGDDADEEFLRFQEELKQLEGEDEVTSAANHKSKKVEATPETDAKNSENDSTSDIQDELAALIGMKCKAPYEHLWGQLGYYNAIVFLVEPIDLESDEGICVRVMFMQPLSERMRPCPYFLSGKCRFEETCKFSHGEICPLSHLKDYTEPDFSSLATGSKVLAKYNDDLWYRAVISQITESGDCEVTYENYSETVRIPMSDTQPLYDNEEEDPNSSFNSSDSESDGANENDNEEEGAMEVPIVWLHMRGTSALGVWEQHTRGMGSKLMQKMGYVFGSGLGKNGEGRIEPVDAVIVPKGRSLDTIMKLKENAGGSNCSLFSAERHLKRLQKREKQQAEKLEKRLQQSQSVFNFLNDQLNLRKEKRPQPSPSTSQQHHKDTKVSLSKKLLSLGESIRQVTRDIAKCKESVKRQEGRDQTTVDRMKAKLTNLESHLLELKKTETKISSEQQYRNDKKKLTIF